MCQNKRTMKAWKIKKIRNRVAKFDTYEIHEAFNMFGYPYRDEP